MFGDLRSPMTNAVAGIGKLLMLLLMLPSELRGYRVLKGVLHTGVFFPTRSDPHSATPICF